MHLSPTKQRATILMRVGLGSLRFDSPDELVVTGDKYPDAAYEACALLRDEAGIEPIIVNCDEYGCSLPDD